MSDTALLYRGCTAGATVTGEKIFPPVEQKFFLKRIEKKRAEIRPERFRSCRSFCAVGSSSCYPFCAVGSVHAILQFALPVQVMPSFSGCLRRKCRKLRILPPDFFPLKPPDNIPLPPQPPPVSDV